MLTYSSLSQLSFINWPHSQHYIISVVRKLKRLRICSYKNLIEGTIHLFIYMVLVFEVIVVAVDNMARVNCMVLQKSSFWLEIHSFSNYSLNCQSSILDCYVLSHVTYTFSLSKLLSCNWKGIYRYQ